MEDESRKTSLNLIAKEVPDGDQVHFASRAEYEKLDGFHKKPVGADTLLQQMKAEVEEEKVNSENSKTNKTVTSLLEI